MLKSELIEQNKNLLKQNGELMYLLEFGKLKTLDSKCQMVWERDSNVWQLQQENQQLKDNWNELSMWTEMCINELKENDMYDRTSYEQGQIIALESFIAKMQELEILKGDKE